MTKQVLLIYADGALRITNLGLEPHAQVYEEAVYVPLTRKWDVHNAEPYDVADQIVKRTFVKRGETARYDIYEEWS